MLIFRYLKKKSKIKNDVTHVWCDNVKYLSLLSCMLSQLSMDDWLSFVSWCECLERWRDVSLCQPLQSKSVWVSIEKEKAARNLKVHFTSKRGSTHKNNYLNYDLQICTLKTLSDLNQLPSGYTKFILYSLKMTYCWIRKKTVF